MVTRVRTAAGANEKTDRFTGRTAAARPVAWPAGRARRRAASLVLAAAIGIASALAGAAPAAADGGVGSASDLTFGHRVLRARTPVLVEFSASWCVPCKRNEAPLSAVAKEFAGRALVVRADIGWTRIHAQRYGVKAVPAILVFNEGKLVDRSTGVSSTAELREMLAGVMPEAQAAAAPPPAAAPTSNLRAALDHAAAARRP
jgi:thioredoxin 1